MTVQLRALRRPAIRISTLAVILSVVGGFGLGVGRIAAQTGDPVLLNEFLVSHTGSDTTEFFELYGAPGQLLAGLSLVVVEGDSSGGPGTLDLRVDLPGNALVGGNGFYLIGNPTGLQSNYGVTPDLALPCPPAPSSCVELVENGSQTIGLVATASLGAQGTVVSGSEDVRDTVGLADLGPSDRWYWNAPVLGPDDGFLPPGGRRISDGVDTDTTDDWTFADDLLGPSNSPTAATPYSPPDPGPGPGDEPPAGGAGPLLAMIDAWVADGSLAAGKSHLLTTRVERIGELLADERTAAAVAQLRALGNQARGLAPRWITPARADELGVAAAALIAELDA